MKKKSAVKKAMAHSGVQTFTNVSMALFLHVSNVHDRVEPRS